MNNLILIGMPGAGKSTVGVVLAKRMGYRFLDSDLVIQEHEGKLLCELIAENGTEKFLKIEEKINASIEAEHTVIATGGSAVYGQTAMEHFQKIGKIVYLKLNYENLQKRLGDLSERGVAMKEGQTLADLLTERTPLYEKYGEIRIDCDEKEIKEIAAEIMERL